MPAPRLVLRCRVFILTSSDVFYTDEREPISSGVLLGCVPDKARASAACIHTHPNYQLGIIAILSFNFHQTESN